MDDWSYIRTAEVLAQTGHIAYNGWGAVVLGWPLYVAALFVKLFGDSFTVIRCSTMLTAIFSVALFHRLFLRVGVKPWNAIIATCSFLVAPVFLVSSVVFMSDMPGLLAVLLCLYGCLRAIASREHAASWIAFAALSNTALGTCRQLAWLGVLVVVPSTLWILRRNRRVLITGVTCVLVGAASIAAMIHWFNRQPYSLAEHVSRSKLMAVPPVHLLNFLLRLAFDAMLFMLPVAFAFAPSLLRISRKQSMALLLGVVASLPSLRHEAKLNPYREWLSPMFLFEPARPTGIETVFTNVQLPLHGPSLTPLTWNQRFGLTAISVLALTCLLAGTIDARRKPAARESKARNERTLGVLVGPYILVYVILLLPRGLLSFTYDRYFLLLLPPLLLWLVRWYQDRVRDQIPRFCAGIAVLVAGYSIVSLHDVFASYRAVNATVTEVRALGIPRTEIDGGWEYNHYTEIIESGVILQPGVRLPNGKVVVDLHDSVAGPCSMEVPEWTPSLHPHYTIANLESPCKPLPEFAPVHYSTWMPPWNRTIVVAAYIPGSGGR